MFVILFEDYKKTRCLYHIIDINDLDETIKNGIKFNDKKTYQYKYSEFHNFFDERKPLELPDWVIRSKAIFGSLNFNDNHYFHSHSVILKIFVDEKKCWVCNENLANLIYEPLVLMKMSIFENKKTDMYSFCNNIAKRYWEESCSFLENMSIRNDLMEGFDAEVLIMHEILPKNLEILSIVSDHKIYKYDDWLEFIKKIV